MQGMNWLASQPLLSDVDILNMRLQDALHFAIQALCAAGTRKVVSRTENFQIIIGGTDFHHFRNFLCALTHLEAGDRMETVP